MRSSLTSSRCVLARLQPCQERAAEPHLGGRSFSSDINNRRWSETLCAAFSRKPWTFCAAAQLAPPCGAGFRQGTASAVPKPSPLRFRVGGRSFSSDINTRLRPKHFARPSRASLGPFTPPAQLAPSRGAGFRQGTASAVPKRSRPAAILEGRGFSPAKSSSRSDVPLRRANRIAPQMPFAHAFRPRLRRVLGCVYWSVRLPGCYHASPMCPGTRAAEQAGRRGLLWRRSSDRQNLELGAGVIAFAGGSSFAGLAKGGAFRFLIVTN
jgi:hypothetical protein